MFCIKLKKKVNPVVIFRVKNMTITCRYKILIVDISTQVNDVPESKIKDKDGDYLT